MAGLNLHYEERGEGRPLVFLKPIDNEYSAEDQADLVTDFIIEKGLNDVTIIGHSLGGGIGLLTAIRHPST
jgi:pimeloyl-ACP methyl ester carboxylesterase